MPLSPVVLATPVALVSMAIEQAVAWRRGVTIHRARGTVGDLANSLGNVLGQGFFGLTTFLGYEAVAEHASLGWFPQQGLGAWVLAFLLVDLGFYWRHRACHRIGILWAIHEVHHQSREFHLGTAQRAPWLQSLPNLPMALAFAWIGVPLPMLTAAFLLKALWGFYTHTTLIGRLGPLEAVMVTPSHHRVHHACNDAYLDRNFGNTLIVWDRLFGTFTAETEAPIYGVRADRVIDDPWASNLDPFRDLADRAATAPTPWGALETLIRPPGWDPVRRCVPRPDAQPAPRHAAEPWVHKAGAFLGVLGLALVALCQPLAPVAAVAVGAVLFAALTAATETDQNPSVSTTTGMARARGAWEPQLTEAVQVASPVASNAMISPVPAQVVSSPPSARG